MAWIGLGPVGRRVSPSDRREREHRQRSGVSLVFDEQRWWVSGGDQIDATGFGVEHRELDRRELIGSGEVFEEPVEMGHDGNEVGLDACVRAGGVAKLRHEARGADSVTGDVTDDDHDAVVRELEDVVPVATQRSVTVGREIARRDVEAFDDREFGTNQCLVEDLDGATIMVGARSDRFGHRGFATLPFVDVGGDPDHRDGIARVVVEEVSSGEEPVRGAIGPDRSELHRDATSGITRLGDLFVRRAHGLRDAPTPSRWRRNRRTCPARSRTALRSRGPR